jgi:hypothetical protein
MSFSKQLQERLLEIGEQELADDPKVIAIIESPSKKMSFYITEYCKEKECFSGYLKGEGIDDWCFLNQDAVNRMDQMNQKMRLKARKYRLLANEPRISHLVPEIRSSIAMARYHRLTKERYDREREYSKGKELDH